MSDTSDRSDAPVRSGGAGWWPAVTCLCPTYGRFERLRDAVACFLLQQYPGPAELLVLNDAPVPLSVGQCAPPSLTIVNVSPRCPTLGFKRQALLEMATTPLVAHWDDDDLYLPWHLSMIVGTLVGRVRQVGQVRPASCVKPGAAWWVLGPREGPFDVRGIHHNVFEGQMAFERERALSLGGYPPLDSGQAKALLGAFGRAGELHTWNPPPYLTSYVYRWANGVSHVSARKGARRAADEPAVGEEQAARRAPAEVPGRGAPRASQANGQGLRRDQDWGAGQPVVPELNATAWARARLSGPFRELARGAGQWLTRPDHRSFTEALRVAVTHTAAPDRDPRPTAEAVGHRIAGSLGDPL